MITRKAGCRTNTASMVYNYTKTVVPILDGVQKQRLDITIDEHVPVNSTQMARGTFLAVQYDSF
jgi:hypothetical protein